MKKKDKKLKKKEGYDDLLTKISDVEESRNRASELMGETMSTGHWLVLLIFAGIIIFCIFYLQTPILYSKMNLFFSTANDYFSQKAKKASKKLIKNGVQSTF